MILDTLTKFKQKKKYWLTPKHPLYFQSLEFKIMYGAAIFMQADMNKSTSSLNNAELDRLFFKGLGLKNADVAQILLILDKKAEIIDYLLENLISESDKCIFMLDLIDVSIIDDNLLVPVDKNSQENIDKEESLKLFARMFDISPAKMRILKDFAEAAHRDDFDMAYVATVDMNNHDIFLSKHKLRYYFLNFNDELKITQELIDKKKTLYIVDRCVINDDIVLKSGYRLVFDNAIIHIFGNISVEGGEIILDNSKLIRKDSRHKACINLKTPGSYAEINSSEADCRNLGMFIRAQDGEVIIKDSHISNTTKGAAVRFWGKKTIVTDSVFRNCYSPDNGGALLLKGGLCKIDKCEFYQCEATKGGAMFVSAGATINSCKFEKCYATIFGAAVYYDGAMLANAQSLTFNKCYPEESTSVQYFSKKGIIEINGEYHINTSTVLDAPLLVNSTGKLFIENSYIFMRYPIKCRGNIYIKDSVLKCEKEFSGKFFADENVENDGIYDKEDMLILDNARGCEINSSEFDGQLLAGCINASGAKKLIVRNSMFRNLSTGRAIFNATAPVISGCTFNYCQKGGIHCTNGEISESKFVNCRAKSGAGIMIDGNKGIIKQCRFMRCVSDYSGGGIDKLPGTTVKQCYFEECKPNNIS